MLIRLILALMLSNPISANTIDNNLIMAAHHGYDYAIHHNITTSPIMLIVDYSKPSSAKRLWLINIKSNKILKTSYVAHGQGSGFAFSNKFSNKPKSKQSSLGFFITGEHYVGKHGLSIKLRGLEKGINDMALKRGIVIHKANYVNPTHIGRSWGCLAVNDSTLKEIIKLSKHPILVMSYYPNENWKINSKFLQNF